MPVTDAINTTGNLFYGYPPLIVYIGDDSGNPPDDPAPSGDPVSFATAYCTSVVRSASGSRLDFAELDIVLSSHLLNRTQPADFTRMVDVRTADSGLTRLLRGDYVGEQISIERDTETLKASVQLRPYHFGSPVYGYKVWDAANSDEATIVDDIVFNPTIDDETVFNRSSKSQTGGPLFTFLWAHPETADTAAGETYQAQTRSQWTLDEALRAVVFLLNPDESFVANPTSYTAISNAPVLRNVTLKLGEWLPGCLDKLLIPHGFNWYVDHSESKPEIKLFKIGDGDEKELFFQAPGAKLNLGLSNTNRVEVSNSIADSFNEVQVLGEFEEAEMTLPLYAGWPAEDDSYTSSELAKDGTEYEGHESAWRLFIANEAGDIDPAVSRPGGTPSVPDLSSIFSVATPHRRVLGEPLTYLQGVDDQNYGTDPSPGTERPTRRPIVLEWSDDAGATWNFEEPTWTVKLCPDQIGVYFDGNDIPSELKNAGDDMRLRITGTVFGDARVEGLATKQDWAVNGRTIRQVYHLPEKFQKRWRVTYGAYASSLYDSGHDADERDDSAAALTYAETLRDQNHYAEVDGEYRLPGVHTNYYQIGDLLTNISGREISLDAAPEDAPSPRYPQIVEIRLEYTDDGPSTVLITDRGVA